MPKILTMFFMSGSGIPDKELRGGREIVKEKYNVSFIKQVK